MNKDTEMPKQTDFKAEISSLEIAVLDALPELVPFARHCQIKLNRAGE